MGRTAAPCRAGRTAPCRAGRRNGTYRCSLPRWENCSLSRWETLGDAMGRTAAPCRAGRANTYHHPPPRWENQLAPLLPAALGEPPYISTPYGFMARPTTSEGMWAVFFQIMPPCRQYIFKLVQYFFRYTSFTTNSKRKGYTYVMFRSREGDPKGSKVK